MKKRIVFVLVALATALAFLLVSDKPDATTATSEPPPLPSIVRPVLVAHSTSAERRARRVKEKLPTAVAIARFEQLEQETFARLPAKQIEAWPQDDDAVLPQWYPQSTEARQPSSLPWLAVLLLPSLVMQTWSDVGWLGDWERCMAWAIIEQAKG